MSKILINAERALLGRLASFTAKKALEGNEIIILNAEKTVISGTKERVLYEAKRKLKTRTLGNLNKSPTHPRRPDTYVRRVIRGMLPWKKFKGKQAFKKIKVYNGMPEEYVGEKSIKLDKIDAVKLRCPRITLMDLLKEIGS